MGETLVRLWRRDEDARMTLLVNKKLSNQARHSLYRPHGNRESTPGVGFIELIWNLIIIGTVNHSLLGTIALATIAYVWD